MEKLNASEGSWFSDLLLHEMEDDNNLSRQCQLNFLDDEDFPSHHDIAIALQGEENLQQYLSSESYSSYPDSNSETLKNSAIDETSFERPNKQLKTNGSSSIMENLSPNLSPSSSPPSPTSQILFFDNSNSSPANNTLLYGFHNTLNPKQNEVAQLLNGSSENRNFETKIPQGQGSVRSPTNVLDHIMAERKRREKLSQSIIALAALIPGLKKMDKASVLGNSIKYLKELQERLRLLEERSNSKEVESVVMVNNDSSLCDENGSVALPHVEARVLEKDVLVRIHCPNQKGLLSKILVEIRNLRLFVLNSSVLPFGDSTLYVTIVARVK